MASSFRMCSSIRRPACTESPRGSLRPPRSGHSSSTRRATRSPAQSPGGLVEEALHHRRQQAVAGGAGNEPVEFHNERRQALDAPSLPSERPQVTTACSFPRPAPRRFAARPAERQEPQVPAHLHELDHDLGRPLGDRDPLELLGYDEALALKLTQRFTHGHPRHVEPHRDHVFLEPGTTGSPPEMISERSALRTEADLESTCPMIFGATAATSSRRPATVTLSNHRPSHQLTRLPGRPPRRETTRDRGRTQRGVRCRRGSPGSTETAPPVLT